MKLPSPTSQILESIEDNFSNQYKKIKENIALVAYSIIRGQKLNTAEIARQMNEVKRNQGVRVVDFHPLLHF